MNAPPPDAREAKAARISPSAPDASHGQWGAAPGRMPATCPYTEIA